MRIPNLEKVISDKSRFKPKYIMNDDSNVIPNDRFRSLDEVITDNFVQRVLLHYEHSDAPDEECINKNNEFKFPKTQGQQWFKENENTKATWYFTAHKNKRFSFVAIDSGYPSEKVDSTNNEDDNSNSEWSNKKFFFLGLTT